MQKNHQKIILFLFLMLFLGSISFPLSASVISINELIEKGSDYDGKEIEIKAEAIGDRMNRGKNAWINVSDGTNAIGLWMPRELADQVKIYGNYKYRGDILKVTGTFYHTCKEHGGESDIHVKKLSVAEPGVRTEHRIQKNEMVIATLLALTAFTLFILAFQFIRRERSKKKSEH